ncbi:outer membrane autotransporter protein [Ereboglobus sp. PH5-5]|uniref:autotransporter outer membrane beta-barrel domain-containing protein n=1 Tax=Ereboglobus sp. PH5-5 TaxID=2940529 RepID=UPI002406AF8F|nr:autotransporter outer membrane beta-barrel domain-containing protein [Ereboglobus sp. PH5-5]MDF9832075.1 outer membrane autotransporter protein [Ereboglobus sp. PH5-5]
MNQKSFSLLFPATQLLIVACLCLALPTGAPAANYTTRLNITSGQTRDVSSGTFAGLTESSYNGGGAIMNAGLVTGTDVLFDNNSSTYRGGAVFNTGTMLLVTSTFSGNKAANNWGGALVNDGFDVRTVIFTGTGLVFISNTASTGGAIANRSATFTLTSGTFLNNVATKGGGGAVYIDNAGRPSSFWGTDLVFVSNTAAGSSSGNGNGGAIYNRKVNMVLISSTFIGNRSVVANGGAIRATDGGVITGTNLVFISNTAVAGGAYYGAGGSGIDTFVSSTFKNNTATTSSGGAIYAGTQFVGEDLVFINNRANGTGSGASGGALYLGSNSNILTSSTFTGNYSGYYGGAIYNGGNLSASGLFFTSNTAVYFGGAIYMRNAYGTINLASSTLEGNYAGYGGAVANYTGTFSGSNLLFVSNTASSYGGALFTYVVGAFPATSVVTSSTFSKNYSGNLGGAVVNGGAFTGSNLLFISNSSVNAGGAIYSDTATGTVTLFSTTLSGNFANAGGAIYNNNNSTFTGTNITFEGNVAGTSGGAIYNTAGGTITGANLVFTSNTATSGSGGAIYSGAGFSLGSGTFSGNTAAAGKGGAIYAGGNITLEVGANETLSAANNKAIDNDSGGFLYIASGSMVFDIGANATANIGNASSIANKADSISAADGSVNLIKTGAGTLTLWARNTYTGTTFVNSGKLDLRGHLSSVNTIVAANSTLAGTGTLAGLVTLATSATLSPGNLAATGTLTILNGLSLANGSLLHLKLGTPNAVDGLADGTSDLINVTGDLTLTGTTSLHVTAQTGFGIGVYRLINYSGDLLGGGTISFDALNDSTGSGLGTNDLLVDFATAHQVNLIQGGSDLVYWDGDLNHSNNQIEGGNGIWDTGTAGGNTNWTVNGGVSNKTWTEGKFAVFGYGPDAVIGSPVTVSNTLGDVTLSGAQFLVSDYVLNDGTLTFTPVSGTASILVGSGDASDSAITATINTRLTGTADLHKIHGGTLVLGGSNTYTGTTVVEGGALKLAHHAATGTGNITLAADTTLNLAFGGTFTNNIAGDATTTAIISGSAVTLAATDAGAHTFAGAWQIVSGGTASIANEANLGAAAATVDIAAGGWLTTSDTTFARTLGGAGVLAASLADPTGTFAFANAADTTGFTGTLDLQSGYLALDAANANVAALANATLRVSSAGVAEVLSNATIGNLTLNGGVLKIAAAPGSNINQFSGTLVTGTLNLAATSTLAIGLTGTLNTAIDPHSNFFSDSGSATRYQLHVVESSTLVGSAGNVTLTNHDGSAIAAPELAQNVTILAADGGVSGTAVYNYRASATNNGLHVGYGLSQLIAGTGTQILLSNAGATSDTLDAALTGNGGYQFAITGTALVGNANSDYLGATHITSGTVILISSTALGKTSLLDIAANAALDLAGHSQTVGAFSGAANSTLALSNGALVITNGGISEGALTGTGSLILNGGLLDIRGANTGLTATATIAATGTARLDNTDGLGSTGLIANAGLLEFSNAQGTLTKSIAGTGTVALASTSTVTLAADNTGHAGVFDIAADSQLIATAQNQLADAGLAIAGIFTASNAALVELGSGNALTGNGQLVKTGSGELRITSSNAFNGTTAITGGTLTLANLFGTGTGAVSNNATLNLAGTGTYANTISGSGVNLATGNVSLRGDNTAFTGTLTVTGTADIDNNNQIGGATAQVVIASNAKLATIATTFEHALSGEGVLAINTSGADFSFSSSVLQPPSPFSGTVSLTNSVLTLGTNANTDVLVNAALQLNAGGALHANNETRQIKALDLNGGALWLDMNGVQPEQVLKVGTLAVSDTTASTVVFKNYTSSGSVAIGTGTNKNFLDQDNITNNATLLVEAGALDDPTQRKIAIKQADGTSLSNGQIVDYGNVHAIYDYTALTVSGTEAAAYTGTGAMPAGLYYDYVLTALDVQAGETLALTTEGATDTTLSADITGLGGVTYAAPDSSVTLSGSNSYSGASIITTGTVIAKADNVLGAAAPLDILADGALDLDAHTQTVTTITTAAGSLLNLNSGSLAITAGGAIDGALAGTNTATLNIAGGTLDITGANADFAASTIIDANATARLSNPAGLGSAAIAFSGTLHLDIAAADSGTLQNALSGDGLFAKTNTGELTLAASGADFHGTGTIDAGRLTATRTDNLGDATIGINAAATYEMRDIAAGTLANTLRGTGTLALTRADLLVTRANAIADTLTVALDQPSNLRLGANGISLGAVHMNSGTITFATATGTATIAALGHGTGNFVLNADLSAATAGNTPAGTIANALTITDAGAGRHNIYVNATGDISVINTAIELVTIENGSAQFVLANPGGKLEHALTTLELLQGDGSVYIPDTRKWYLTDAGLSHAADAILNTAATLALDWNYSLDSLYLRMGELRWENQKGLATADNGNLWVRSRGYRLNANNELSGLGFKQYGWGVNIGADKRFDTPAGRVLAGALLDMGGVNRDFDNHGNGDTDSVGFGLYATLINDRGWFADMVAKIDRYDNEFEARAHNGAITRGKYTSKAQGLSLEAGKLLMQSNGWWIEPAVQVSVLWINSADYSTAATDVQRAIGVSVASSTNYQYRARVRGGRQFKNTNWHPYGKFAVVGVDSSGGKIRAHGKTLGTDYDGCRFEAGIGVMYRINDISQAYFDYEYAKASNYDRPWSINLGYRRLW